MKVAQVMPEFGLAGAEIMCENLCYELKKQNIDVFVISLYSFHSPITKRLEENGFKVYYLGKHRGVSLGFVKKLRSILKCEKPDCIHTHRYILPYVFLSSIGFSVKIIHTVHNIAKKEVGYFRRMLHYLLFRSCKVVPVAIAPKVKDSIVHYYKLDEECVPMVYNGIDLSAYIKKTNYFLHGGGVIVHVGRFSNQKNHKRLIDALAIVHNEFCHVKLLLIGGGELECDIHSYVDSRNLGSDVFFLGKKDSVIHILNDADIFVLSSDYEGMPLTIIEAMATGLPIVATKVGGIPDMIEDGVSGTLVDPTGEDIAKALIAYLTSRELRQKHGNESYSRSSRFSSSIMAMDYIRIYRQCLNCNDVV